MEEEQETQFVKAFHDKFVEIASISLHAIVGIPSPRTMRILKQLKTIKVMILKNTSSTHNFMDASMAIKGNLAITKTNVLQVRVVNGEILSTEGKCSSLVVHMQVYMFKNRVFGSLDQQG